MDRDPWEVTRGTGPVGRDPARLDSLDNLDRLDRLDRPDRTLGLGPVGWEWEYFICKKSKSNQV